MRRLSIRNSAIEAGAIEEGAAEQGDAALLGRPAGKEKNRPAAVGGLSRNRYIIQIPNWSRGPLSRVEGSSTRAAQSRRIGPFELRGSRFAVVTGGLCTPGVLFQCSNALMLYCSIALLPSGGGRKDYTMIGRRLSRGWRKFCKHLFAPLDFFLNLWYNSPATMGTFVLKRSVTPGRRGSRRTWHRQKGGKC